jgi:hypothetical protein
LGNSASQTPSEPFFMSDERRKPWYVSERADLLAKLFLEDLKPEALARADELAGMDYMAVFLRDDGGFRIVPIEVKVTERPVRDRHVFYTRKTTVDALKRANVPVLFLIVDTKNSEVYYGWPRHVRCVLPVKSARDGKEELLTQLVS